MRETRLQSLGWEDSLEKDVATRFSISCLEKSHGWRRLAGYSPWGRKESDMTERLHFTSLGQTLVDPSRAGTLCWETC